MKYINALQFMVVSQGLLRLTISSDSLCLLFQVMAILLNGLVVAVQSQTSWRAQVFMAIFSMLFVNYTLAPMTMSAYMENWATSKAEAASHRQAVKATSKVGSVLVKRTPYPSTHGQLQCRKSKLLLFREACFLSGRWIAVRRHVLTTVSWFLSWKKKSDRRLKRLIDRDQRVWINAILFGRNKSIRSATRQAFKAIGHYHLLVLSGLHFRLIVVVAQFFLQGPSAFLYATNQLSYWGLRLIQQGVVIFLITLIWLYYAFCETSPAVLRAALASAVYLLAPYFFFLGHRAHQLQLIFAVMLMVDPVATLSLSSLISWYCVIIISAKPKSGTLFCHVARQWKLMLPAYVWFGGGSVLGAVLGVVTVPIFTIVILAVFCQWLFAVLLGWRCDGLGVFADVYAQGVEAVAQYQSRWMPEVNQLVTEQKGMIFVLFGLGLVLFLNALATINSGECDERLKL